MKPINIGIVTHSKDDACSFYRSWGPLSELMKSADRTIALIDLKTVSWSAISPLDIVFIQRPFDNTALKIMEMARFANVPTWVDWDDALWLVGQDNPTYPSYGNKQTAETVSRIAEQATLITVSTRALADNINLPHKTVILPNCLPVHLQAKSRFPWRTSQAPLDPVRIVWRGSSTHAGDWLALLDHVAVPLNKEIPNTIEWILMGTAPFFVPEKLRQHAQVACIGEFYIEKFFKTLIENRFHGDIMFVPLKDTPFNRCKSNIAQLEATAAGMITVAPDWPEWQGDGSDEKNISDKHLLYKNPADSFQQLANAILLARTSPDKTHSHVKQIQTRARRLTEKTMATRQQIISTLIERTRIRT